MSDFDALVAEYCRKVAAILMPCWVCGSTEVEHECPPHTKELRGLKGLIDDNEHHPKDGAQ